MTAPRFLALTSICLGLCLYGVTALPAAQAAEDTVAHWMFEEAATGGANSVLDSSGSNNHGTPQGSGGANTLPQPSNDTPENIPSESERSLHFDGTDDTVLVDNPFSGDEFTISLWVKPAVLNTNNYQGLMGWDAGDDADRLPSLWISPTNNGLHYDSLNTAQTTHYSGIINNFFPSANTWVHIAWVKDGDTYDIYRNGTLFVGNIAAPSSFFQTSDSYLIGDVDNKPFSGNLDDIRIYSRALTQDEVAQLAGLEPAFPLEEEFDGTQPAQWKLIPQASWNASHGGSETLRLTTASESQSGMGFYDRSFPSELGFVAEFTFYSHEGNGADGLAFFLVDGDQVNAENIHAGAFGGSLGYAQAGELTSGIPHAYLGIGFDEYGNFAAFDEGATGGPLGRVPDSVTLRGSGNGTTGYAYLTHTNVSSTFQESIDGGWRTARITVTPTAENAIVRIEMSWDGRNTWHTVINDYQYNEAPPDNLKLGFTASTGGFNNVHAIGSLHVALPVELETTFISPPNGTYSRGDAVEYAFQVENHGPNNTTELSVLNSIPIGSDGLTNVVWNAVASHGPVQSGTGADIAEIIAALPAGETLTVTVSGVIGAEVVAETSLDHVISSHPGESYTNPAPSGAEITVEIATDVPTQEESEALNTIIQYAETNGQSQAPTTEDYGNAGVGGVTEENLPILNQLIAKLDPTEVEEVSGIEAQVERADATLTILTYSTTQGESTPPTVNNYTVAGITGVTEENLETVNQALAAGLLEEENISESIQLLITQTLAEAEPEPEAHSPSSGKKSPSRSKPRNCSKVAPQARPNLFQIDASTTQARVYFAPVPGADSYVVAYSTDPNQAQHSTSFSYGDSSGVISYLISDLQPNTQYFFTVQAANGCMAGEWSNTLEIQTRSNPAGWSVFYKDVSARVQSWLPRQVTQVNGTVLGAVSAPTPGCQTYVVKAGDSLWSIASLHLGQGSRFAELLAQNGLNSSLIHAGQTIQVACGE